MQNVPKIVTERLKAAPVVAHHPEADVLTAFAERSLPEQEREIVLEHVSRCGECREVLALALPETEAAAVAPSPVRTPWVTWPAVRWGLVTAGVVAIAAFGVVQYQRRADVANMVAKQSPTAIAQNGSQGATRTEAPARDQSSQALISPAPASAAAASSAPPSATSSDAGATPTLTEGKPPANSTTRVDAKLVPLNPQMAEGVGHPIAEPRGRQLSHGPRMPQQWQPQSQLQGSVSAVAPAIADAKQRSDELAANKIPASSEMVEVQGQNAQLDNQPKDQLAQMQALANEKSLTYAESLKVDKAKPATPASAETMQVSASAGVSTTATVGEPQNLPTQTGTSGVHGDNLTQFAVLSPGRTPAPSWIITAAGALERSFDHGATWQSVDVNAANPIVGNMTGAEISLARAKKTGDRESGSMKAASPIFRTVAAAGTEVWAGGSNGALYHSLDAGTRWIRVAPVSGAVRLTGDIVALEFSDSQHGRLTTSASEVWTTADDGQTWQKQ